MGTSELLHASDALAHIKLPENSVQEAMLVQNFYGSLANNDQSFHLRHGTSEQDKFIQDNYITFVSMKRKRAAESSNLHQLINQQE